MILSNSIPPPRNASSQFAHLFHVALFRAVCDAVRVMNQHIQAPIGKPHKAALCAAVLPGIAKRAGRLFGKFESDMPVVSALSLSEAFAASSPRVALRPAPLLSLLLYGGVVVLWIAVFCGGFLFSGIFAWTTGLLYITYDTALLLNVTVRTWFVQSEPIRAAIVAPVQGPRPSLGVIVAARNEQNVLVGTIKALFAQTDPPDEIIIADDGSTDQSAAVLAEAFGLVPPSLGEISTLVAAFPGLRLLRLVHGGKARALNAAIEQASTDVFLTVDADTILEPEALAAMRAAFADDVNLVAACGVLTPTCHGSWSAGFFQWFQTYEYIRAFVSRVAWAKAGALLLVSGAFAGFRRQAVCDVGGFDPECLVEDYELIHRLHRHSYEMGQHWKVEVLGNARGITDAPGTLMGFLRQRRRWFAGFLQTQYWNRDITANPKFGVLGRVMMPIKAVDTMQPIYGLTALLIFFSFLVTGRLHIIPAVLSVIAVKILIDLGYHLWSVHLYARWIGRATTGSSILLAICAAFAEPFSFQLMRHAGAAWGWFAFVTGRHQWTANKRVVKG